MAGRNSSPALIENIFFLFLGSLNFKAFSQPIVPPLPLLSLSEEKVIRCLLNTKVLSVLIWVLRKDHVTVGIPRENADLYGPGFV